MRYPNGARIWNYHLRSSEAADELVLPEKPTRDSGAAWNLSAIGIKA